jgi:hypothetical protein
MGGKRFGLRDSDEAIGVAVSVTKECVVETNEVNEPKRMALADE